MIIYLACRGSAAGCCHKKLHRSWRRRRVLFISTNSLSFLLVVRIFVYHFYPGAKASVSKLNALIASHRGLLESSL